MEFQYSTAEFTVVGGCWEEWWVGKGGFSLLLIRILGSIG